MNPQVLLAMLQRKSLTTLGAGIICLYLGSEYPADIKAVLASPLVSVLVGAGALGASTFLSVKNAKGKGGDKLSPTDSAKQNTQGGE